MCEPNVPNVWYPMHSPISIENRYTWLMRSVLNNEAVNIQYVGGRGRSCSCVKIFMQESLL